MKNPALGAGAFDTLIPAPQTLILSRRVSAVSKDGERVSPSGANFALRYAASTLLRVRRSGGLRRKGRDFSTTPKAGQFPGFVCKMRFLRAIREMSAPVAQLDRASDYGSEGREFESSLAHHLIQEAGAMRPRLFVGGYLLFSRQVSAPQNSLLPLMAEYPYNIYTVSPEHCGACCLSACGPASLAHVRIFTESIRRIGTAPREILHRPPPRERIVFAGNNAIWRIPAKRSIFFYFAFCYEKVTIRDIFEAVLIYAPIKISPCGCPVSSSEGRNLYSEGCSMFAAREVKFDSRVQYVRHNWVVS